MGKKLIGIAVIAIMLFGFFGLVGCDNISLADYKVTGKAQIDAHVATKTQDDYSTDKWAELLNVVAEGKQAVEGAMNKDAVDTAVNDAKMAIDEVKEEREMADFVLTISVDNNTKNYGEDFVVVVSLKNQSGEDISISYYHSPFLANIENWQYPHPPFGLPSEPDILALENGGTFTETWSLGAIGYLNPVTYESSSLPTGTHDLHFSVRIVVDQSEIIVRSNTIKLIVK